MNKCSHELENLICKKCNKSFLPLDDIKDLVNDFISLNSSLVSIQVLIESGRYIDAFFQLKDIREGNCFTTSVFEFLMNLKEKII